jgi:hypothetical protein
VPVLRRLVCVARRSERELCGCGRRGGRGTRRGDRRRDRPREPAALERQGRRTPCAYRYARPTAKPAPQPAARSSLLQNIEHATKRRRINIRSDQNASSAAENDLDPTARARRLRAFRRWQSRRRRRRLLYHHRRTRGRLLRRSSPKSPISERPTPAEHLARMQTMPLRHRADARIRLKGLRNDPALVFLTPAPAPLHRDDLRHQ